MTQVMRMQVASLLLLSFGAYNYLSANRRKTVSHFIFQILIMSTIFNVVSDLLFLIFMDNLAIAGAMNKMYMFFLVIVSCLLQCYVDTIGDEIRYGEARKIKFLWCIPAVISCILSLAYPYEFYLAEDGIVHFRDCWAINFLYGVIAFYALIMGATLVYNFKIMENKQKMALTIAYIICVGMLILQAIDSTNTVTSLGLTAMLFAIYIVSENPDELLIEQLNFEKDKANAANASKSSFIAHVSHEIRTPINAILGMDEIILRETKESSTKAYAEDISNAAYALYGIINDVLDMSKMESGRMDIVPGRYNLNEVLYDVISLQQPKIDAKQLDFFVNVDPTLPLEYFGDDIRIRQVLTNILSNAVKYTHEGSVSVNVSGEANGDIMDLLFSIKDTGIGIKKEDIKKLFIAFERIEESRNRNIEGTGLGMNITSNLLRLMGSRLKVDSTYGKGSEFSFVLSQRIVNHEPLGNFDDYVHNHEKVVSFDFKAPDVKILVVDDNALNRKVFSSLLKETQISIFEAPSGAKCLDMIRTDKYDMIFLDHMMPDMDGVETIGRIKTMDNHLNADTPIIMLTANAVGSSQEEYRHAGFDAYLSKPIFSKDLEKIIRVYVPAYKILMNEKSMNGALEDLKSLPAIKGIDWDEAITHLPTPEVLFTTLSEFVKTIDSEADALVNLERNLEQQDNIDMFRIKIHALKGTAAMIGADMLSNSAKELEMAAKDKEYSHIHKKFPAVIAYYRGFKDKLQMFAEKDEIKEKKIDIDFAQVIALVKMVGLEMEDLNRDNAYEALDELDENEFPKEIQIDIDRLRHAVDDLELDDVAQIVETLVEELRELKNS